MHLDLPEVQTAYHSISRKHDLRNGGSDVQKYFQAGSHGEITLLAAICRKAKVQEGDLLEPMVENDRSIRLVRIQKINRLIVSDTGPVTKGANLPMVPGV